MITAYDRALHARLPIIPNPHMAEPVVETAPRSWKERLFSWPWRPWVKEKSVMIQIPSKSILILFGKYLVCHPETAHLLHAEWDRADRENKEQWDTIIELIGE